MPGSGAFWGDIGEWMGFNNDYSSAGKERVAAQKQFDLNSQFNSAEALKNRDFQREMSNTAVQRRMEDLQKAGINPILAAGQSASTPSGSSASVSSAKANQGGGFNNSLFDFLSSGTSAVKYVTGDKNMKEAFNSFLKVLPFILVK